MGVQHYSVELLGNDAVTAQRTKKIITLDAPVPVGESYVIATCRGNNTSGQHSHATATLADESEGYYHELHVERYGSTTSAHCYVEAQVITDSQLTVQSFSVDLSDETSVDTTINEVNESIAFIVSTRRGIGANPDNTLIKTSFHNTTTLRTGVDTSSSANHAQVYVVEWEGATVTHIAHDFWMDASSSVYSVGLDDAYFLFSYLTDAGNRANRFALRADYFSNYVYFTRGAEDDSEFYISLYAVEHEDITVQSSTPNSANEATELDETINAVSMDNAFVAAGCVIGNMYSTCSHFQPNAHAGWNTHRLKDTTTVTVERSHQSGGAMYPGIFVVEFADDIAEDYAEGGSEASVRVAPEGTGTKNTTGSSEASTLLSAEGSGTKAAQGSSTSTVSISAEGAGIATEYVEGGSEASVSIIDEGVGVKQARSPPADAEVQVASEGSGTKKISGSSEAGVIVSAEGHGTKKISGSSEAEVAIIPEGAGHKIVADYAQGGSEASVNIKVIDDILDEHSYIDTYPFADDPEHSTIFPYLERHRIRIETQPGDGWRDARFREVPMIVGVPYVLTFNIHEMLIDDSLYYLAYWIGEDWTGAQQDVSLEEKFTAGTTATIIFTPEYSSMIIGFAVASDTPADGPAHLEVRDITIRPLNMKGALQGSESAVVVSAEGAGGKKLSGSSEAAVVTEALGGGVKQSAGSSESACVVTAEGQGTKGGIGGTDATVVVSTEGAGVLPDYAQGGSEASVTVTPEGAGTTAKEGASTGEVVVTPEGVGSKVAIGASEAYVVITAEGAGTRVAWALCTVRSADRLVLTRAKEFVVATRWKEYLAYVGVMAVPLKGNTVRLYAEFYDLGGDLTSPTAVVLKIYDHKRQQLGDDIPVTPEETGKYQYDYTIPMLNIGPIYYEFQGVLGENIVLGRSKLEGVWIK